MMGLPSAIWTTTASLSPLVIPAGAIAGATTITISPIANDGKESDEKIGLNSSGKPKARDDDDVEEELEVIKTAITLKDTHEDGTTPTTPDPTQLAFAADASISSQTYTVGTAITDLVLPEATGGTAPLTYIVSTLPAGLARPRGRFRAHRRKQLLPAPSSTR